MESFGSFCKKVADTNYSYNEIEKILASVGISLKNEDGTFKNLTDIFQELANEFDKF